jgi:hypothetical protein
VRAFSDFDLLGDLDFGRGLGDDQPSPPQLRVTVLHTTTTATITALETTSTLAKGLCQKIRLLAVETVPIHFSLQRPHVTADFLEDRLLRLVFDAQVQPEEVSIEVFLCRNQKRALSHLLAARSLVVLAGRECWWDRGQRMARWLRHARHQVVFTDLSTGRRRIFIPARTPLSANANSGD